MPELIDNIEGIVIAKSSSALNDNIDLIESIESTFGYTDWFSIGDTEFYLLNFKKVVEVIDLKKTSSFGLNANRNKTFKDINISY